MHFLNSNPKLLFGGWVSHPCDLHVQRTRQNEYYNNYTLRPLPWSWHPTRPHRAIPTYHTNQHYRPRQDERAVMHSCAQALLHCGLWAESLFLLPCALWCMSMWAVEGRSSCIDSLAVPTLPHSKWRNCCRNLYTCILQCIRGGTVKLYAEY